MKSVKRTGRTGILGGIWGFLKKLWKHRQGRIGLIIVAVLAFCAIFAPLIVPNDPYDVTQRAEKGLNYGVVLIPEGLIKAISEFYYLLDEISTYVNKGMKHEEIYAKLTPWSKALFDFLPAVIQKQIFNPPESRGSFQLHAISTEVMIGDLVKKELQRRKEEGSYNGHFDYQTHFLGYQARTSFPSLFDCDYAYALGREAAALIQNNLTGYMATLRNLKEEPTEWIPYAVPLLAFCTVEAKQGVYRPSIPVGGENGDLRSRNRTWI